MHLQRTRAERFRNTLRRLGCRLGGGRKLHSEAMGCYQDHCTYLLPMVGWFIFSALLSSYNKLVFGSGHLAFPCPLLLTSVHFLVQWVFSWTISALCPRYFGGDQVRAMSWKAFLSISVPCGLVTSGDVGLSNLSLVRISITFYTMIKASTPIFVLTWAYLFGIERVTSSLLLVVVIIALGEFLTVMGEVEFDTIGFVLCLSASVLSGARWTLVQLKLHSLDPPLKTTIATMRVLSPSMFLSMLIVSLLIEQPWDKLKVGYFDNPTVGLHTLGLGLIGAFLAIAMILCEFYLIMNATAIILMIGGVIKEMITILVGVYYFGDALNATNVAGCTVVFFGVVLYKITYHLAKLQEKNDQIHPAPIVAYQDNDLDFSQGDDDNEASAWIKMSMPSKKLEGDEDTVEMGVLEPLNEVIGERDLPMRHRSL